MAIISLDYLKPPDSEIEGHLLRDDCNGSDGEQSNTPPATTVQSTAGNLLPVASSISHDLNSIVEASSPEVDVGELSYNPPNAFVPSIGAWAKPLAFSPPTTPPTPATPLDFDPQYLNNLLDSFWPSITDGIGQNQKKRDQKTAIREFPRIPVPKIPVPELKDDGTLRFPWAARMNPATRNLYRAAKPTFRLDGTPQVTIPSQVLSLGPENKREYVIGQFHRCSLPPGGLIHAVVNRLWGRSCRIGCRKLSESSYLFHIPHDATRDWVIQRSVWHVDDCLLFVSPWKPANSLKVPEVSTIPVWVNLKNVPDCCYSRLGLSHVASGLGEPMQTHKPRLDPTTLGEAKLLVEVELDKPFPKQIALDDKQGNIFLVDVEYTRIPSICGRCGHLGHKEKRCLLPAVQNVETTSVEKIVSNEASEVEPEREQAQSNVASDQVEVQMENSEASLVVAEKAKGDQIIEPTTEAEIEQLQSQKSVELKALSTPSNLPTHSKVTIAIGSNSHSTSPPLSGTVPDPAQTIIMEEIPSPIIVSETRLELGNNPLAFIRTPTHGSPFHYQTELNVQDDGDGFMSDATANLNMSRGGRPIKPLQKYQDMEWNTIRGKGKRGRRGRGYHTP
ncbi:uncharacterized protein LOC108819674 [Raphanus sativus]|uniref:Uncharacterized protein LOC108819674 n=1 Tax=Raphanus sativus TaxID=3726 RepID=A0A6J0KKW2_RAPSA|nr:uncharacterized protein LOC108819674 [Raphanus sativus]